MASQPLVGGAAEIGPVGAAGDQVGLYVPKLEKAIDTLSTAPYQRPAVNGVGACFVDVLGKDDGSI
jgi:hypothetical protein